MRTDFDLTKRDYLLKAASRLRGEFSGVFAFETIELVLSDSLERLSEQARVTSPVPYSLKDSPGSGSKPPPRQKDST